jgi:iron complex transport system permease protein
MPATLSLASTADQRKLVRHDRQRAAVLLLASFFLVIVGSGIGSTGIAPVWPALSDPLASQIVWDIRLPRTLGAWAAGALLGLAGAVAQGLFRNPLADPFLLGSASGSSLGVALALAGIGSSVSAVSLWSRLGLTLAAFSGALAAVLITLSLARGVQQTYRLLLAGVIVGMLLGALTSLVTLLSPDTLQAMQGFLLGTTGFVGWSSVMVMTAAGAICIVVAVALARALDGLALGEATAGSLGVSLRPARAALVGVLALSTATAVAHTGLIAFIGLMAPHLVRARVKSLHGWLLGLSSLTGGVLLLVADLGARSLVAPGEIPLGLLTALLGGGYLLWLMHRHGI